MKTLQNNQLDSSKVEWPAHMQRALDLAGKVLTATPNPRVGCVIINGGAIVGEGWHKAAGQDHAEIMALKAAGDQARAGTAFISLEPCCHTGKTGPCSEALITAGVSRVAIASLDSDPRVSGKGVDGLEAAGIEVVHLKDFEAPSRGINPGYFKRHEAGLPFVRLKLAMSLDGRTALANGESKWITSAPARADVQRLRALSSGVITGVSTVLADDPALNVRYTELALDKDFKEANREELQRQPLRVIIDSQLRTPGAARILLQPGEVKIYTSADKSAEIDHTENVDIRRVDGQGQRVDLYSVLESLATDFSCNDVLVEAGPTLSGAFIEADLVDELIVYIAPKLLGSDSKPLLELVGLQSLSECIQYKIVEAFQVGQDMRMTLGRIRAEDDQ